MEVADVDGLIDEVVVYWPVSQSRQAKKRDLVRELLSPGAPVSSSIATQQPGYKSGLSRGMCNMHIAPSTGR